MSNKILSTGRRIGVTVIIFLSINLMVSPASANLFEVTYKVTFLEDDFWSIYPPDGVFGKVAGPVDAVASFLIETGVAPDIFIREGEPYFVNGKDHLAGNDFMSTIFLQFLNYPVHLTQNLGYGRYSPYWNCRGLV